MQNTPYFHSLRHNAEPAPSSAHIYSDEQQLNEATYLWISWPIFSEDATSSHI